MKLRYYDAETNWYYLESRYYNPEWCRFISPDNLFIAGDIITGSNMYAYCNNDPVSYIDPSGTITEEEYEKGNTIRRISKVISWAILPVTVLVVAPVSNLLLDEIKEDLGDDPLQHPIVEGVVSGLEFGAYEALGNYTTSISGDTYNVPTGLRHFMPVNMAFGAPWAGYFLNFKEDGKGNYTSDPNQEMWQSLVGYTPTYDFFFSLGGPIFREKYEFQVQNNGPISILFPKTYYVVWIWKGDYWNLGAGAEIGIYRTSFKHHYENGFYEVVTDLTLDVDMTITYKGEELNHLVQTNWWVCSFTPEYQLIDIDLLEVFLKVKFTDPTLREPFYNAWADLEYNSEEDDNWKHINMTSLPPYDDTNIDKYQFELEY